jgi:N-acetyl-gamma-glutamyl-phosphate reductase
VPSAAVIGATGYTGALAASLLWRHPSIDLVAVTSRSEKGRLDDLYPRHRVPLELEELDVQRHGAVDAAIVAYPHGASSGVVAALRARGARIVDLSADFRLRDPDEYARWYGDHEAPELVDDAVYGLTELYRDEVADADLVANPGCYPTATLLALAPLARAGLIADVVVDAKSGVSGAGRAPSDKVHFVTADENVNAYGVPLHRHVAEIDQELALLGAPVTTTFTTHLLPLDQGELVTCYFDTDEDVVARLAEAYAGEPFIELVDRPPGVRDVRETNFCRIHAHQDGERAIVFAAIDNLWKGTASQAVQNLNLMFGRPETEGLL